MNLLITHKHSPFLYAGGHDEFIIISGTIILIATRLDRITPIGHYNNHHNVSSLVAINLVYMTNTQSRSSLNNNYYVLYLLSFCHYNMGKVWPYLLES